MYVCKLARRTGESRSRVGKSVRRAGESRRQVGVKSKHLKYVLLKRLSETIYLSVNLSIPLKQSQ